MGFMIALLMDPTRLPSASPPRRLRGVGSAAPGPGAAEGATGGPGGGGLERRRRVRRAVLTVLGIFVALVTMVSIGLGKLGDAARPARPLLGAQAGVTAVEVLAESARLAPPPAMAANRFDAGWEARRIGGAAAWVATRGTGRLLVVHLGEETERVLTLDLLAAGLPEGLPVSVRTGERELARSTVRAAALPLRLRLPADLPIGDVQLDVLFGKAALAASGSGGLAEVPAAPAVAGTTIEPALAPGMARVEGADMVQSGNCLVYVPFNLTGNEGLVGTFVPPGSPRAGQRFELSVERADGTPIRRFHWLPSFWNHLRGARRFELPLRGTKGPVRLRLISRAATGDGPAGRWQGLGLVDVRGEILTPGQGQ
jgi:hypothetical protein